MWTSSAPDYKEQNKGSIWNYSMFSKSWELSSSEYNLDTLSILADFTLLSSANINKIKYLLPSCKLHKYNSNLKTQL